MNMERRNASSIAIFLEIHYLITQHRASYQFLDLYEFGPLSDLTISQYTEQASLEHIRLP